MWVKLLSPILIMASTSTAPHHHTKNCHRCTNPCPPPVAQKHEANDWKSGFEVVAGFRWDQEIECPTQTCPQPTSRQSDPFYLGLQQRIPLTEYLTLQARVDRDLIHDGDFLESPHWNGAVSVAWAPWR